MKSDIPKISVGDTIFIGSAPLRKVKAVVTMIHEDGDILNEGDVEVVYYPGHGSKAIKTWVLWSGVDWTFAKSGPDGSYVNLHDYPNLI